MMKSAFFLALVVLLGTGVVGYSAELIDRVTAVINGEIVAESDLMLEIRLKSPNPISSHVPDEFLHEFIRKRIYLQEAKRQGIGVSSRSVDQIITDKRKGMSIEEFEDVLSQKKITLEEYKRWLRDEVMIYELRRKKVGEIDRDIRVYEEEVEDFYRRIQEHLEFGRGEPDVVEFSNVYENELAHMGEAKISQILVRSAEQADNVLERLRKGQDFSTLAKELSLGPRAKEGGELGWISLKDLKSPLKEIIENLGIHGTAKIKEENLFRIIQLEDRKEIAFSQYVEEIERYLKNNGLEEQLREWFESLESKAVVEILPHS